MEKQECLEATVCREIGARTGGEILIGVVGPVRTGKSTLIKQFMEQLVLPAIGPADAKLRARAVFESASVSPENKDKNKNDTHYQVSLCWWELVDSNDFMPPYPAKILTNTV